MFWPAILPLQITATLWAASIVTVWFLAPRFGKKRAPYVTLAVFIAFALFIPSVKGVMDIVDGYRFGVFEYSDSASINDWRVERYFPDAATNITLEKDRGGFRARYSISKVRLEKWLDHLWDEWRDLAHKTRERTQAVVETPQFDDLGWQLPKDAAKYSGPRKRNGAGFTIWYSEKDGIAYEDASYW
jgi:hypothetical protein